MPGIFLHIFGISKSNLVITDTHKHIGSGFVLVGGGLIICFCFFSFILLCFVFTVYKAYKKALKGGNYVLQAV